MFTSEDNDVLSHVGPGTPMGALFRRYWLPALLSRELEANGAPVRVRLVGEDLIAFRDSEGRVGLLAENCPHRGASLYFAKNDDCGLRCWYHGWKFDIEGKCLDMPNEPPQTQFKDRIRQLAYPCIERNGVVLTYMGPADKKPGLPELEWLLVPENQVYVSKRLQQCHWLQGLEGDIDSAHVGFLHGVETIRRATEHDMTASRDWLAKDAHPQLEVVQRPNGLLQGARREADEKNFYWRIGGWLLPCFSVLPGFPGDTPLGGHAWVPVDEHQVWTFGVSWHPQRPLSAREAPILPRGNADRHPLDDDPRQLYGQAQ